MAGIDCISKFKQRRTRDEAGPAESRDANFAADAVHPAHLQAVALLPALVRGGGGRARVLQLPPQAARTAALPHGVGLPHEPGGPERPLYCYFHEPPAAGEGVGVAGVEGGAAAVRAGLQHAVSDHDRVLGGGLPFGPGDRLALPALPQPAGAPLSAGVLPVRLLHVGRLL